MWRWTTEKLCGGEGLKVGCVENLSAHWSFLPRILGRFGKRGIRIWVEKYSNSGQQFCRLAEILHGSERHKFSKGLHPNYLCIQRTRPMFSRSMMLIIGLTWFHSSDFLLSSGPKHRDLYSGLFQANLNREGMQDTLVQALCSSAGVPFRLANAGFVCPRRAARLSRRKQVS